MPNSTHMRHSVEEPVACNCCKRTYLLDREVSSNLSSLSGKLANNGKSKMAAPSHGFSQILEEMQKATETGWDSLVNVCYETRKVVGEFSFKESMVDEINVDFYAQQIVPSQELEEYVPLNSTGDGSCLYRSFSLLVAGNELKHVELRARCVIQLDLHSTYYLADEELVERIAAQERLLGVEGNDSGLVDADFVHEIYKTEVMKTCQLFEYASMFQIQALGAVLRRKIRSVYPETTPEVRQYFHITITPRVFEEKPPPPGCTVEQSGTRGKLEGFCS